LKTKSDMNPNEMEMATEPGKSAIVARPQAVLKHTQIKRWHEVRCGLARAERLDCVRFIAAFLTLAPQGRQSARRDARS
jgi:hypothetical protein